MALTNAFRDAAAAAVTGGSFTAFNTTNARIGVGDSGTAFAAAQTDLQAGPNKLRIGMDATYPQVTGSAMTFKATFGGSDANFAWNEWAIFNAASGGVMMTRKVESLGTKVSGAIWVVTATITLGV